MLDAAQALIRAGYWIAYTVKDVEYAHLEGFVEDCGTPSSVYPKKTKDAVARYREGAASCTDAHRKRTEAHRKRTEAHHKRTEQGRASAHVNAPERPRGVSGKTSERFLEVPEVSGVSESPEGGNARGGDGEAEAMHEGFYTVGSRWNASVPPSLRVNPHRLALEIGRRRDSRWHYPTLSPLKLPSILADWLRDKRPTLEKLMEREPSADLTAYVFKSFPRWINEHLDKFQAEAHAHV